MIRTGWKRFASTALCLGIALACLIILFPRDKKQMPVRPIGVNPDYAFPTKETPPDSEVDSAALVDNANAWNGRTITFTGEAIGEQMIRGDMAWIHINDDAYAKRNIEEGATFAGYNSGHAIWLPAELARQIRFFGDYRHAGDIVTVIGVFHAADPEHGGDMDIHATSLTIVRPGHPVIHVIDTRRALLAAGLLALASLLYGVRRNAARRRT